MARNQASKRVTQSPGSPAFGKGVPHQLARLAKVVVQVCYCLAAPSDCLSGSTISGASYRSSAGPMLKLPSKQPNKQSSKQSIEQSTYRSSAGPMNSTRRQPKQPSSQTQSATIKPREQQLADKEKSATHEAPKHYQKIEQEQTRDMQTKRRQHRHRTSSTRGGCMPPCAIYHWMCGCVVCLSL